MLGQVIITTALINNMRDIGTGSQRKHIGVGTIMFTSFLMKKYTKIFGTCLRIQYKTNIVNIILSLPCTKSSLIYTSGPLDLLDLKCLTDFINSSGRSLVGQLCFRPNFFFGLVSCRPTLFGPLFKKYALYIKLLFNIIIS